MGTVSASVLGDHWRILSRRLQRRGSSREDAEDLVQEAMLRLHAYTRDGGQVRDPAGFVTCAALHLAIDAHRRSRKNLYERNSVEELGLVDLGPGPDEVFAAEQRLHRLKDALERLSSRTRQIFLMHRLQGFSHAEVAEKLSISTSAVEKHIASAVTVLALERQHELKRQRELDHERRVGEPRRTREVRQP